MKEIPIPFNGDMVRAIREGRKTQTRRPVDPQPTDPYWDVRDDPPACPFGCVGDVLWVREKHWINCNERLVVYAADCESKMPAHMKRSRWRPSIHMPRWASRIKLEVISTGIERVQFITQDDAIAEGMEPDGKMLDPYYFGPIIKSRRSLWESPRLAFTHTWDSIYSKRGLGWDANPFVWKGEFRVL